MKSDQGGNVCEPLNGDLRKCLERTGSLITTELITAGFQFSESAK